MDALAVILGGPEQLAVQRLPLTPAADTDAVVAVSWSGISTGTERLLWSGRMPPFPGMGYPLVPGYESVGTVVEADAGGSVRVGQTRVRAGCPLLRCRQRAVRRRRLPSRRTCGTPCSGGSRSRRPTPACSPSRRPRYRALGGLKPGATPLIVGHGVLGRLLARLTLAAGAEPTVWETDPVRAAGDHAYPVLSPETDPRRDYAVITDVSGHAAGLDDLIARLAPGGEIVLAGFYEAPLSFAFPPAFMREARIRISAEFRAEDTAAVTRLIDSGRLSLDGLITHRVPATQAQDAYRTAFADPACLKMILDWRDAA